MMDFVTEFEKRGFLKQCTDLEGLKKLTSEKKITAYIGFDCTATSLHIGSLTQIMVLRLLQQCGHKPIVLVGGATTKIGDPTGKDKVRQMLDEETIEKNKAGIKKSLSKFITFGEGPSDAIMLDNDEWLSSLNYLHFLRDYGKHFSINKMLTMESVKQRLEREQNLSFLEFNYMILQAVDFTILNDKYNCVLQIGGSDQWGNIVMGTELGRKMHGKELYGLTTNLLTNAAGQKMGKTVDGAVWLNEENLSPYNYFQYWRNCDDSDILRFAKLFAEYNESQITELENLITSNINEAKKQLAYRLTEMCHGREAAEMAAEAARKIFEQGGLSEDMPKYEIKNSELDQGISILDLLHNCGLSESKSEARKLIRGGGARLNDVKVEDENMLVNANHKNADGYIKLSSGKKKHILIVSKP